MSFVSLYIRGSGKSGYIGDRIKAARIAAEFRQGYKAYEKLVDSDVVTPWERIRRIPSEAEMNGLIAAMNVQIEELQSRMYPSTD